MACMPRRSRRALPWSVAMPKNNGIKQPPTRNIALRTRDRTPRLRLIQAQCFCSQLAFLSLTKNIGKTPFQKKKKGKHSGDAIDNPCRILSLDNFWAQPFLHLVLIRILSLDKFWAQSFLHLVLIRISG